MLRGGGSGNCQRGNELPSESDGESKDNGTLISNCRTPRVILDLGQSGSRLRGGVDAEVVAVDGQGGQKTMTGAGKDVASRKGCSMTTTPLSVPAAMATRKPFVVDAQEDALRAALLQAQEPSK